MDQENSTAARGKPGPKPDPRRDLKIKLQPETYEAIEALQPLNGLMVDENAAMLLHVLMRDPHNVARVLEALNGNASPSQADPSPEVK